MHLSGFSRKGYVLAIAAACLSFPGFAFASGITVIPDKSVVIQVINFLFLIWVLNQILYKPVRNVLNQRKEKISGLEERIEAFTNDLSEKEDAYAQGIKDARANGLKEKEKLLEAAGEEEKALIDKINQKAQANLAEVREKIEKNTDQVRESLLKEVDGFAESISGKILGGQLNEISWYTPEIPADWRRQTKRC